MTPSTINDHLLVVQAILHRDDLCNDLAIDEVRWWIVCEQFRPLRYITMRYLNSDDPRVLRDLLGLRGIVAVPSITIADRRCTQHYDVRVQHVIDLATALRYRLPLLEAHAKRLTLRIPAHLHHKSISRA